MFIIRNGMILMVFLILPIFNVFAQKRYTDYKSKIEVPEPLFIDLVRGLDAKSGEWEINSLFRHTQGDFSTLQWAPEIEIVITDGLAIEFEFPIEGDSLQNYKMALQKTLNPQTSGSTLHGLQYIYETDKRAKHYEHTLFYILAHRFNYYLSSMTLMGVRVPSLEEKETSYTINQSFFFNYSKEIDFGIEMNYFSGPQEDRLAQVIPQLHLALEPSYKIQFGFGATEAEGKWQPVAAFRIIREFNFKE